MLESLGTRAFVIRHPFSYLSIRVEFNPLIFPFFLFSFSKVFRLKKFFPLYSFLWSSLSMIHIRFQLTRTQDKMVFLDCLSWLSFLIVLLDCLQRLSMLFFSFFFSLFFGVFALFFFFFFVLNLVPSESAGMIVWNQCVALVFDYSFLSRMKLISNRES